MEQIVVKTEVQPNGDILLFYLNGEEEQDMGVLSSIEGQDDDKLHILSDSKYVVEDFVDEDSPDEHAIARASEDVSFKLWQEEESKRLLTFYIDNKETFLNGSTRKIHLWAVACKTMLSNKKPISCEAKLLDLKKKYAQLNLDKQKGVNVTWPLFDLCHNAFHDDSYVKMYTKEMGQDKLEIDVPALNVVNKDGVLMVKKVNAQDKDEKVEAMLNLYMQQKKYFQRNHNVNKGLWESIALNLGEEDVDYWRKRFLNFKQHYVRMLYKRSTYGPESINWPYMEHFDQIFADDVDFQNRFQPKESKVNVMLENDDCDWIETEKTFLVKYYFDCFQEFQDSTIPKKFLWQEVGRLLDKKPERCKTKYDELKDAHFDRLIQGGYNLNDRIPLDILFDNIISKEVEIELEKNKRAEIFDSWSTQLDELVNYLYENIYMLKDSVCFFVCWAALAKKLSKSVQSCKNQWDELTTLYKSILNEKKEYPDMQINWKYIDWFDRIFDYGMDTNLLDGYKKLREQSQVNKSGKVGVKKITIKESDDNIQENGSDEEEVMYDERGFTKRSKKHAGDMKAFKILEYYLKNKDKFSSSQYKKLALWDALARQIGIPATECAHRFRNFKQVYTRYIQREINKPEMPILWPYYTLCKKVFGYRAIKSKLKNGKIDSDDAEDWSAKEIKQLIKYFASNYYSLIDNVEDRSKWSALAQEIGKSEMSCCDKFLELRKSYRKLKTMKARNPDVKVSWKYFNMIDDIYKRGAQNVNALEQADVDELNGYETVKMENPEDEDFQCIIVIPEGEDVSNAQIIIQGKDEQFEQGEVKENNQIITKWNRRSKTKLLKLYYKYIRTHATQEINVREMWTEIASELDEKTPISCKKMYLKLKNQHKQLANENIYSPYSNLVEKILAFQPKHKKLTKAQDLDNINAFKDVQMSDDKVYNALNYYLQNLEDFVSPKFEHKYLWTELAKFISEPVVKVFHKINYLKETFKSETDSPFSDILQEILSKENALRDVLGNDQNMSVEEEDIEEPWSDIETERLLTWYLAHLDKFKNPKFVRSYLWMEASDILKKSPLICSKKMCEIRSQYRTMVKDNPDELENWKFYNLCQRIYGTGKKSMNVNN